MKLLIAFALLVAASASAENVSPAEQHRVARAVADLIERRYVDADKARTVARALRAEKWKRDLSSTEPDVAVPAGQALERAVELARTSIIGRSANGSDPRSLPLHEPGR